MESESEGGQKFLPPNPLPFCPPERLDFKIRNSDFRQKKFEHQSKNTAINIMNKWDVNKYIQFIENSTDPLLKKYMRAELDYIISTVEKPREKILVDVGAGYGRVLPVLSKLFKHVIAVEIDKEMFSYLEENIKQFNNVLFINGDAQNLQQLLGKVERPVVVSLQNSLGTPFGDAYKIISEMVKIANNKGELIISLFVQEGLKDYGIPIYNRASGLTGRPDLEKTNFGKGLFISENGYQSHWWNKDERKKISNLVKGKIITEITTEYFYLLHVKYY